MSSIYIHIPYCKQACTYCNFHFSTSDKNKGEMIDCIGQELREQYNYLGDTHIDSIYFGGGTPSILLSDQIEFLLSTIYNTYKVTKDVEITLEGNPDDLTKDKLKALKDIGINRLSIGVQSFNDIDLVFMNRSHNFQEAINCINAAKREGFKNINIDLIYGLPHQSLEDWNKNLDILFSLNIQHFSAYSLTVEKNTKLKFMIDKNHVSLLEDADVVNQYNLLLEKSLQQGFINYEISNFGLKDRLSKHNLGYWKNINYLGVGPSAHSFNGKSRRWNISSNTKYIKKLRKKELYFESETLDLHQRYNEYIFTSIRTMWGVDISIIKERFTKDIVAYYIKEIKKWEEKLYVIECRGVFTLTKEGKIFSDLISSDLFIV